MFARTNELFADTMCLNFFALAIFIQVFLIFRRPDHVQTHILATLYSAIRKGIATTTKKKSLSKKLNAYFGLKTFFLNRNNFYQSRNSG